MYAVGRVPSMKYVLIGGLCIDSIIIMSIVRTFSKELENCKIWKKLCMNVRHEIWSNVLQKHGWRWLYVACTTRTLRPNGNETGTAPQAMLSYLGTQNMWGWLIIISYWNCVIAHMRLEFEIFTLRVYIELFIHRQGEKKQHHRIYTHDKRALPSGPRGWGTEKSVKLFRFRSICLSIQRHRAAVHDLSTWHRLLTLNAWKYPMNVWWILAVSID